MNRRSVLLGLGGLLAQPAWAEWQPLSPRAAAFQVRTRDNIETTGRDYAGSPVLLHFWASWCASCRTEFPALDALQRDMAGQGLRILAVSVDRLGWPVIDKTAEALGLRSLTLLHDLNREAAKALDIVELPTTLMLDRQGREVARHRGTVDWDAPDQRARIRRLIDA